MSTVIVTGAAGGLDGLVNCAGIMRRGSLAEISPEDWDAIFTVNVHALYHLTRAALPALEASGHGSVVNISSQWGLVPAAGHIAYNTTKAAVASFSKSLARDHGHRGIRSNAVCPGEILTPMVEQKLRDGGISESDLAADIPVGRLGRPRDVADLVAFLLSDRASFISGATIEISGGQVAP